MTYKPVYELALLQEGNTDDKTIIQNAYIIQQLGALKCVFFTATGCLSNCLHGIVAKVLYKRNNIM